MKQQRKTLERERLVQYIDKLSNESDIYSAMMKELQGKFISQAEQLIKERFMQLEVDFAKLKKNTEQELLTLRYFQSHPEEKGNLFALFNQIDEKMYFNSSIIQSTHFQISLPHPSPASLTQDITGKKLKVYQNYVSQLLSIVKSENIRKYCKKEAETVEKLTITYQKMLQNTKQSLYCTQVSIKKPYEQALSQLSQYKHVENLTISLLTPKGIMSPQQYHALVNALLPNRLFLSRLQLKIMDMEFSQEKCDILRKRITSEFDRLRQVAFVNYYKECKLGMFEDFSWQPYRKKVNVTSGVW